jgi:hypothetical protein
MESWMLTPDGLSLVNLRSGGTLPYQATNRFLAGPGFDKYPDFEDDFTDAASFPSTNGVNPNKWNIRDRSTFGLLNDATIIRDYQCVVVDNVLEIRGDWMDEVDWQYTTTGPQGDPTLRAMRTGYLEHRITSGTDTIYAQRYGCWEYRAQIPMAPDISMGTLGAVWLRNGKTGEIDMTEGWGSGPTASAKSGWYPAQPKPNAGRTTFTIHSDTMGGGTKEAWTQPSPAIYAGWATYRFYYTPNEFTFLRKLDGETEFVQQFKATPTSWESIPGTRSGGDSIPQDHFAKFWTDTAAYDSPWHIRMNLHIGPSTLYWGVPDPDTQGWTANPRMYVDYVRMWEWVA